MSQIEELIPDNQVICQSGKPDAFIRMAHAFLKGIAAIHSLLWRFVGGEHAQALRSRERGCFLVVQTLWAEKIQSTTDAGSLNTFAPNEIEVAPISLALLRIACLVILYKTCRVPDQRLAADGVSRPVRGLALDYLSKMKIAVMVRQLDLGHILWCGRVVRVQRAHRVRVVRGVQKVLDVGNGVIGFDHVRFHVRDLVMAFLEASKFRLPTRDLSSIC